MLFLRILLCCDFLFLVVVPLQLNLDLTEWVSNDENDHVLQYDCLHTTTWKYEEDPREMTSYCMSEWPSKWNIQKNNFGKEFTFAELVKLNVTSHQLYLWSAPMDTVEHYQLYLNQLSISNGMSMGTYSYFNCTPPNFGPMCQYPFHKSNPYYSSLSGMISESYWQNSRTLMNQTCYIHLQCNLGITSLCIGWINICDGIIQCIDGIDEEHCWQLEINECNKNEYRCKNGQCISVSFFHDNVNAPDCLDGSIRIKQKII